MVGRKYSVWAVIIILSFVISSSLEAVVLEESDVLKSVDDDGTIYYSDQPLKGIDFEWVDNEVKNHFSFEPSNVLKEKKPQVLPSRRVLPKSIQPQKQVRKNYGQATVGGTSTRGYPGRTSTERTSARGNSSSRASTDRTSTNRTSARGNSAARTSTDRTSTRGSSSARTSTERSSTR